jgi:hyperosmotically inducible periplasmic protein
MKYGILAQVLLAAGSLVSAGAANAADKTPSNPQAVSRSDADLEKQVRHELLMYPRFSIWDDLSFRVANGQVQLSGEVTQPYKKDDMEHLVRRIPGVVNVASDIKVLPLSNFDDRLRLQVARAIYGDPVFTQYAMMALPPVHIIVDNGHVTLTGVVATDMEKIVAGMRATGTGLSFGVVNNLQVEHPAKKS